MCDSVCLLYLLTYGSVSHYRTHTTEHTVPLHTLIFCTSVRWNLCIFEVFFWQGSHFRLILRLLGLPFALQADLLLQVGRPFVLQVDSCFRIVFPSLFTYLPTSVGADLDENGPPVMNQIARGGYSLTPPEGGTTRVPLASGLRSQTPPSSSTLPGRFEPPTPRPCVAEPKWGFEPATIWPREPNKLEETNH